MVRRTLNPEGEGYMVVAGREQALVTSEPLAGVDTHIGRSERPHIGRSERPHIGTLVRGSQQ
jgi:hypothetical protein